MNRKDLREVFQTHIKPHELLNNKQTEHDASIYMQALLGLALLEIADELRDANKLHSQYSSLPQ